LKSTNYWIKASSLALAVFVFGQLFELAQLSNSVSSSVSSSGMSYSQLCVWDCQWYAATAQNGYDLEPHGHERKDAANWAFFPVLPMTARAVGALFPSLGMSAVIVVSKFFFLLSILAFIHFCKLYAPRVPAWVAACVAGLHPYSIYGNVGYTESLFLLLSCVALIAIHQQRFLGAGMAGALLSAVRPQGVFILFPVLLAAIDRSVNADQTERLRLMLAVLLVPAGLALFMLYLHSTVGDALAFSHVQIAWNRFVTNPFSHLYHGVIANNLVSNIAAWMSIVALLMCAVLALRGKLGLALFALSATLLPLSTGLLAMPRYLWWQAPLLLLIAELMSIRSLSIPFFASEESTGKWVFARHDEKLPLAVIGIPLFLVGLAVMYRGWLSGEAFVV
jgi:Gpi18-like mannosyltransferase